MFSILQLTLLEPEPEKEASMALFCPPSPFSSSYFEDFELFVTPECTFLFRVFERFNTRRSYYLRKKQGGNMQSLNLFQKFVNRFHQTMRKKVLMGIMHSSRPHYGLLFHPESVATCHGQQIFRNFAEITKDYWFRMRSSSSHERLYVGCYRTWEHCLPNCNQVQ